MKARILHRVVGWSGLFLAGAVSITYAAPVITQQPQSQTVNVGGTLALSVTATGTPPLTYQWQYSPPGIPAFFDLSGATGSSYSTTVDPTINGNGYRCMVTDLSGSVASNVATLTIPAPPQAPSFMSQPQDSAVSPGQSALYSVIAMGDSPLSYQWQIRLPGAAPPAFNAIAGATSASYSFPNAQSLDSGSQFRCVVSNATGTVTSTAANLTVVTNGVAPVITVQPQNQTAPWGQMVTFNVQATGTPAPTYQWQVSPPGTPTFSDMPGETNSSYITTSNPTIDGARFRCVVSNVAGTIFSNVATLTVGVAAQPPSFFSQPQDVAISTGQSATFSVFAVGDSPLAYQWQVRLPGAPPPAFNNISGATAPDFTFSNAKVTDNGSQFRCVVSNSTGTAISVAANLTVIFNGVAPTITQSPQSITVAANQITTFTVTATGTQPLTYLWQISQAGTPTFSDWPFASGNTMVVTATPSSSGNRYRVVVSNVAGSATSLPATLTVVSACDLNADGTTNVVDVQREVNMALGIAPCTADLNLDTVCNVVDIQRIVNNALGGPCVSP